MKNIICITAVGVWLAFWGCGCSTRTITVGEYTYKSTRFLTKENFGALTVETNKLTLKGYQNEQSAEDLGLILGTALKVAK